MNIVERGLFKSPNEVKRSKSEAITTEYEEGRSPDDLQDKLERSD
jgi:hypothetical protein